jgi:CheY-like chemotaxis protein
MVNIPNILVVDDNVVSQRLLSHTLRKAAYRVFLASNGLEALTLLEKQAVNLAIVDIAMPEMDGLALLQRLRDQEKYQSLPVIMLTASGDDQDRNRAEQAGANGFLTKPASSFELLEAVRKFLP